MQTRRVFFFCWGIYHRQSKGFFVSRRFCGRFCRRFLGNRDPHRALWTPSLTTASIVGNADHRSTKRAFEFDGHKRSFRRTFGHKSDVVTIMLVRSQIATTLTGCRMRPTDYVRVRHEAWGFSRSPFHPDNCPVVLRLSCNKKGKDLAKLRPP